MKGHMTDYNFDSYTYLPIFHQEGANAKNVVSNVLPMGKINEIFLKTKKIACVVIQRLIENEWDCSPYE